MRPDLKGSKPNSQGCIDSSIHNPCTALTISCRFTDRKLDKLHWSNRLAGFPVDVHIALWSQPFPRALRFAPRVSDQSYRLSEWKRSLSQAVNFLTGSIDCASSAMVGPKGLNAVWTSAAGTGLVGIVTGFLLSTRSIRNWTSRPTLLDHKLEKSHLVQVQADITIARLEHFKGIEID